MKYPARIRLVAITGGSGAGKSWLAESLDREFPGASRLALDDFYRDLSHLPPARREQVNFDDPDAIDWDRFEAVLRECRRGREIEIELPHYDFATHTRLSESRSWKPGRLVFVEGLWLLRPPAVRALFDVRIFLECPAALRCERRVSRDVVERGRTLQSGLEQFRNVVSPMHDRFVAPQKEWADVTVRSPLTPSDFSGLAEIIRARTLQPEPRASFGRPHFSFYSRIATPASVAPDLL